MLASGAAIFTTFAILALLRWLAPQLLGIPVDLQLVQASRHIPPFYDNIFREEDFAGDGLLLHDPHTNLRLRPLLPDSGGTGPHDLLGFRNPGVPNHAGLVVLGDSQTYGIGEPLAASWPSQLAGLLTDTGVYSMAVGGWGAVQYLALYDKALRLGPDTIIVAFYSGNDPLDSFATAYGNDHWQALRPDPALDRTDAPAIDNMLALEDAWPVTFSDGVRIAFTPKGRLAVNDRDSPAVRAGYAIMAQCARRMSAHAARGDTALVFTVIPTRELVYATKVAQEGLAAPQTYRRLVTMEQANIAELAGQLSNLPGARYVDLVAPLQAAALADTPLYPRQWDGHPGQAGYAIIAATLATALGTQDSRVAAR